MTKFEDERAAVVADALKRSPGKARGKLVLLEVLRCFAAVYAVVHHIYQAPDTASRTCSKAF